MRLSNLDKYHRAFTVKIGQEQIRVDMEDRWMGSNPQYHGLEVWIKNIANGSGWKIRLVTQGDELIYPTLLSRSGKYDHEPTQAWTRSFQSGHSFSANLDDGEKKALHVNIRIKSEALYIDCEYIP